jgi:hypothetical protein
MHMLPTPASIEAQVDTRRLQGRTGLWFAGGYLFPYDAQETALLSAIEVANGLNGGSTPRGDALLSSVPVVPCQPDGSIIEAHDESVKCVHINRAPPDRQREIGAGTSSRQPDGPTLRH